MVETSREKININKKIVERKEVVFVEGDMIIPDAKPDILKPISLSGIPTIYKKEALEGRVRIDGNINTYIMYSAAGEQLETRGINTSLDFSETLEIKQAVEGANLNLETKVNSIECKVVNERKINIRAALEIKVQMSTSEEIEIINNVNEEGNLQVLKDTLEINSLIGTGSTRVYGKEALQIDTTDSLAEILKASVTLLDKDTKISYNKVLAKTDAEVKLLYLTEENNIKLVVGKVPIVGFVDLPDVTENSICEVNYEIKNLILKPNNVEEHSVYVELETEINCLAYEAKQVNVVRDLYSPYESLNITTKQVNAVSLKKNIVEKNVIHESVAIEHLENKKILDVEATPIVKNETIKNSNLRYECEMNLRFVLQDTTSLDIEIKEEKIDFNFATNILESKETVSTNVELQVGEQDFTIGTNNQVDCNMEVTFAIGLEKVSTLQVIDEVEATGERPVQDYSVIIYIVKAGDTLWKIAKKFGGTVKDIVRVNEIEDENSISVGQKIFIPRFYKNNVEVLENG